MYNGLTTADKTALLELKKCGAIETKIYHVVDIPNVDEALAHIAEMESKPLTWNERINQMTVEERASMMLNLTAEAIFLDEREAIRQIVEILNSPYTEGETK